MNEELEALVKALSARLSSVEEQLERVRQRVNTVERTLSSVVLLDYPSFRAAAREAYERLNQSNRAFLGVVPIPELRRALGARLTRQEFDENLVKMHQEGLVQLMVHPGTLSEEREKEGLKHPTLGPVYFVRWERQP